MRFFLRKVRTEAKATARNRCVVLAASERPGPSAGDSQVELFQQFLV
jgi:hypothetical protein